jgi:hypothetical protein
MYSSLKDKPWVIYYKKKSPQLLLWGFCYSLVSAKTVWVILILSDVFEFCVKFLIFIGNSLNKVVFLVH